MLGITWAELAVIGVLAVVPLAVIGIVALVITRRRDR